MAPALKRRRVLLLVHEALVPPEDIRGLTREALEDVKTERDVLRGLRKLGHEVRVVGLLEQLEHSTASERINVRLAAGLDDLGGIEANGRAGDDDALFHGFRRIKTIVVSSARQPGR